MKRLKLFIIPSLLFLSSAIFAQMGVTSYSVYAVGINTSQDKSISGELKVFANKPIEDTDLEISCFYNFKPRQYHRFSAGVGLNFVPFEETDMLYAITIPASIEIFPLQNFKKVSLLFELAPEIFPEDGANLRSLWGIRYTFGGN